MKVKYKNFLNRSFAIVAACTFVLAGTANAAIESYSNVNVFGFGFYNDNGGGAGPLGTRLTQGVELMVDVGALSETSNAFGSTASQGAPVATVSFTTLDTMEAYSGAGLPTGPNNFSNVPGIGTPFARGDTDGSGRAIVGIGGPFGTRAQTVAEGQLLEDIGDTDAAVASSNVSATAQFTAMVVGTLDFVVDFNASLNLASALIPTPPASSTSAESSWGLTITDDAGVIVFSWDPNGTVDASIIGGTEILDSFDISQTLTTTTGSMNTVTELLQDFRASGSLAPGVYTFTVEQGSRVDVQNIGGVVIPEPMSFAVWGVLVLTTVSRRRRIR